jgi:hypothetical protein
VDPRDSGRLARSLEPLHAFVYFAPESEERCVAAGLKPGRMTYFAARAAPMGAVGAGPVAATFYNFSPTLVARHIPAAWALASPDAVHAARNAAVDAALRRMLGDDVVGSADMAEAAELAGRAARAATFDGRALAAAWGDAAWPDAPHLRLWHALAILREHRGDGHIALLVEAGLSGIEALVSYTASGRGFVQPFARASRGWSEQEWDGAVAALAERGVLDASGALSEDGLALRKRIEDDTNRLGHAPWAALEDAGAARLGEIGGGLVRALVAAGCFPDGVFAATPRQEPGR